MSSSRKRCKSAFINEREIKGDKDIIEEIKKSNSLGVGITGGDPFVYLTKALKFSRLLKKIWKEIPYPYLPPAWSCD